MTRLKLYQAKLRAALRERKQWLKHMNRAERAIWRLGITVSELEQKIIREEAKQWIIREKAKQ